MFFRRDQGQRCVIPLTHLCFLFETFIFITYSLWPLLVSSKLRKLSSNLRFFYCLNPTKIDCYPLMPIVIRERITLTFGMTCKYQGGNYGETRKLTQIRKHKIRDLNSPRVHHLRSPPRRLCHPF